ILGYPLLERIGRERRQHRAPAGQNAEHRAKARAAHDRIDRSLEIGPRRNGARDLLREHAALGLVLEIANDLPDSEKPHHKRDEFESVRELRHAEGKARRAGIKVLTDGAEKKPSTTIATALISDPCASATEAAS